MKSAWLNEITETLSKGASCQLGGLWGSSYAYILSEALSRLPEGKKPKTLLVVLPTIEEAELAGDDFASFMGKGKYALELFPFSETGDISTEPEVFSRRLQVASKLISGTLPETIIIASVQALAQMIPSPKTLLRDFITLKTGESFNADKISARLIDEGFTRQSEVTAPGEFSVRGGIIDIFSPDSSTPVRIELSGDKIESLRAFSPDDQSSREAMDEIKLCLNKLEQAESYLVDYLPKNTLIAVKEPSLVYEHLAPQGEEIVKKIQSYQHISFQTLPTVEGANFQITSLQRFNGGLTGIAGELETLIQKGLALTIFCQNKAEVSRLHELLPRGEKDIEIKTGRLNAGFIFPEISRAFISYNELFNRYHKPRRFRSSKEADKAKADLLEPFLDLEKGDFVVHLKYGIGRFKGIEQLDKNGYLHEYLVIEYQDRAKIYVPVHQADMVEKYIAGTDRPPQLSRLGTDQWDIRKERVKTAISHFARELLEIQALRETQKGIAFPPDTEWQNEFEAAFPYEETPDQLQTNEIIKEDMKSSQPMDRLICGDVGYGKTELAIRAAFKAAAAGYQVAVLVPTTILAQQHYQTFRERMADYPVRVEMISRFRSKSEQQKIIADVREGTVDIIIGTHRLVQPDIEFKNLGLIVIDEEQRFGVEHKERLRKLKALVDALTLTATPIPRTLHMSLLGIRDISTLATPPLDRRAVVTQIIPFDESIVRMAITRELKREGQIYFVHNRIYDIEKIADRIKAIVPGARVAVGHGQLPEAELEETMKKFIEGETDILVSTNIIESGLDIPRVNTIFIHNADNFGLADLHQLRGRVGRYKHQAYAYLIASPKVSTGDATKRLKAITEFNELGAGFKIALRDMEIRGVGNILGREQHGHIASVGYDLYCKLLEQSVKMLKGAKTGQEVKSSSPAETSIELRLNAYLPVDYVTSEKQRMKLYRKISRISGVGAANEIRNELKDRFGTSIPPEIENLLELAHIKILAQRHSIVSIVQIEEPKSQLILHYMDSAKAKKLKNKNREVVRIVDNDTMHINLPPKIADEPDKLLEFVKKVLS
ncbi:MAG: transcription-repair coupling factor [Planctomycetes bacterium]|nr:transcription-repair coupling factor [Planctomycetota bacterium]